ncbi:MAG: helix-turn-helix transcriptional regulator [Pseudoflavonifractor sp.]|nr:helix-turn-helix transcriptional regulator [Pseudoflavonifractor sp.]
MDVQVFVQNVKQLCSNKGVSPTAACKESQVGTSFIPDIKRGRTPSVDKFEKLAGYLGVTVSELLGEEKAPTSTSANPPMYNKLNPENRALVDQMIEKLLKSQSDD